MRLDKKKERLVEEVHRLAELWLIDVKSLGNQTAYSESMLDVLLKKTDEIKEILEKQYGERVQN